MSSRVDLYNFAINQVGGRTLNSYTDNEREAELCNSVWDISRRSLIESADWNFTKGFRTLARTDNPSPEFAYAFIYPTDCLQIKSLIPHDGSLHKDGLEYSQNYDDSYIAPIVNIDYEVISNPEGNGRLILTNYDNLLCSYIKDITDTEVFPPLFFEALSYLLASKIAIPLTGNTNTADMMLANHQRILNKAAVANLNERKNSRKRKPALIRARESRFGY